MALEGVVTNVTAFGAFVDVGEPTAGLVHVSEMTDRFIKDPHEVVKAGDVVRVRVKEVDVARKRIALSMKSAVGVQDALRDERAEHRAPVPSAHDRREPQERTEPESALAAALRRAQGNS